MEAVRLGVLGGSFNPIHLGHLHIARRSREIFGLSQVVFVVATTPPHKLSRDLVPFPHRYAMVSLATSGCRDFLPSLVELEPPASAFSIETLAKLSRGFGVGGTNIYFIAGGDSLKDVSGWYESQSLLMSYNFIFVMRPGVDADYARAALPASADGRVVDCRGMDAAGTRKRLAKAAAAQECRIYLLDAEAPDIAASQIREMASAGQSIEHLVPASVNEYIVKLHLYGE